MSANARHDKSLLQGQIDGTDREIDRLVCELYDLTEEEIKIVEDANRVTPKAVNLLIALGDGQSFLMGLVA